MKIFPSNKRLKLLVLLAAIGVYLFYHFKTRTTSAVHVGNDGSCTYALQQYYENHKGDQQVQCIGIIEKVLSDDNVGSRHQRLIVRLDNGQTIMIAHNIDVGERISDPMEGNQLEFYGEYEWNEKGGVVHWTHHDPKNRHPHGWIKYNGKVYD